MTTADSKTAGERADPPIRPSPPSGKLEKDFGGAAERQSSTPSGLLASLSDLKEVGLRTCLSAVQARSHSASVVDRISDPAFRTGVRVFGTSWAQVAGGLEKLRSLGSVLQACGMATRCGGSGPAETGQLGGVLAATVEGWKEGGRKVHSLPSFRSWAWLTGAGWSQRASRTQAGDVRLCASVGHHPQWRRSRQLDEWRTAFWTGSR